MGRKLQKAAENSNEIEIMGPAVDRVVRKRTFEPFDRPVAGCRFIRFRARGESVTGQLGYPIENFRQGKSYPLKLDTGEIVEVIGNKQLHKLINKGELCGRHVRIEYQGRQFLSTGHHRKIYRIFEQKNGPIFSKAQWSKIIEGTKAQKRRKKNG